MLASLSTGSLAGSFKVAGKEEGVSGEPRAATMCPHNCDLVSPETQQQPHTAPGAVTYTTGFAASNARLLEVW